MAAKKSARRSFVRKGDVSFEQLQAQMKRLKDLILTMEISIVGMKVNGIATVQVDGLNKIEDGTRLLTEYVANACQAIDRASLTRRQ